MNNHKTPSEIELARAILAYPRAHYEKNPKAAGMLPAWDELAEKYPEIVEATQYFSAPVRPDCMALRFVEEVQNGGTTYLWLDLKTSTECRSCCYTLEEDCWVWCAGDSEPAMSMALQKAWEAANPIINRVRESRLTCFVS